MTMLSWMYWTIPVAIIFVFIFVMITGMTIWGKYRPPHRRKGFLRIVTDRGERLYIALVALALVMVGSFAIEGTDAWISFGVAAALAAVILKWG